MSKEFEMSDLSRLSSRNHQRNEYIELKQTSYAKKVLKKAGMAACNPTKYPMEPKIHLNKDDMGKTVNSNGIKAWWVA